MRVDCGCKCVQACALAHDVPCDQVEDGYFFGVPVERELEAVAAPYERAVSVCGVLCVFCEYVVEYFHVVSLGRGVE